MGVKNFLNNLIFGKEDDTNRYDGEMVDYDDEYEETEAEAETETKDASNIKVSSGASIEMVVVKPEKIETVTQIADYLVDRKTILLNLEETDRDTSRRLIDFLNGVAYAINGDLRKVATSTYVITPSNVELSGEKLATSQEAAFTKE